MTVDFRSMVSCSSNLSREQRIYKRWPQKHPRAVGIIFQTSSMPENRRTRPGARLIANAADPSRTKRLRVVMRHPEVELPLDMLLNLAEAGCLMKTQPDTGRVRDENSKAAALAKQHSSCRCCAHSMFDRLNGGQRRKRPNLQHSRALRLSANALIDDRSLICSGSMRSFGRLLALLLVSISVASSQTSLQANVGAIPLDRLAEPWWAQRHHDVLQAVKAHPDTPLLLLGDSITQNYEKSKLPDENFQPTWQTFYEARNAINLGFSGDTTANLLWRLRNGEISGVSPKVAVVLIGTNNTGVANQTAIQTQVGIDAVVAELEQSLPSTHILLIGLLPSELSPQKSAVDQAVNRYLAGVYSENPRVTYLDISSIFFANGRLNSAIYYDPRLPGHPGAMHPDTKGQYMMAEAIEPTLARLLGEKPRKSLESMTDINTALIPVDRLEQDSYDWYARHHAELAIGKMMDPRIVLIGDSITHFWAGVPVASHVNGDPAWQHAFGDQPVLNLGFGWDRTQNVLWRIRQGEFDNLHPNFIVVNIGTNNLTGTANARANSPDEVVDGIEEICRELKARSPTSAIILMSIFPRGFAPEDPLREPIRRVNQLLVERFANKHGIEVVDLAPKFLAPDQTLPRSLMPDGVHPSNAGYEIWADALRQAFQ
jgi:lysophospholipase L1-like esterase